VKFEEAREVLLSLGMHLDQNVDGKEEAGAMYQADVDGTFACWSPGHAAVVDGSYTADQLEAMAVWMRVNSK